MEHFSSPRYEAGEFGGRETEPLLYRGEVTAYRFWSLSRRELRSVVLSNCTWTTDKIRANCGCFLYDTPTPHKGERCGFYGWTSPKVANQARMDAKFGLWDPPPYMRAALVFGAAAMSGRIIPGTKGLRAEKAKILGLVIPPYVMKLVAEDVEHLRAKGFKLFSTQAELLRQFPPEESLPWRTE